MRERDEMSKKGAKRPFIGPRLPSGPIRAVGQRWPSKC